MAETDFDLKMRQNALDMARELTGFADTLAARLAKDADAVKSVAIAMEAAGLTDADWRVALGEGGGDADPRLLAALHRLRAALMDTWAVTDVARTRLLKARARAAK